MVHEDLRFEWRNLKLEIFTAMTSNTVRQLSAIVKAFFFNLFYICNQFYKDV